MLNGQDLKGTVISHCWFKKADEFFGNGTRTVPLKNLTFNLLDQDVCKKIIYTG